MSNIRQGYAGVDGAVTYGTMDSKEAGKYPGEIVFCSEDDTHYPDVSISSHSASPTFLSRSSLIRIAAFY